MLLDSGLGVLSGLVYDGLLLFLFLGLFEYLMYELGYVDMIVFFWIVL